MTKLYSPIFNRVIELVKYGHFQAARTELASIPSMPAEPNARKLYCKLEELINEGLEKAQYTFSMLGSAQAFYGKGGLGWESIVRNIQATCENIQDADYQIIPHLESSFLWECDEVSPHKNWIGILHSGVGEPESPSRNRLEKLFTSDKWNKFKSSCKAIVVFTESQKLFLNENLRLEVTVLKLPLTIPDTDTQWSLSSYQQKNIKRVIYAGASDRCLKSFSNLKVSENIEKVLIRHTELDYWQDLISAEATGIDVHSANLTILPFAEQEMFKEFKESEIFYLNYRALGNSSTLAELVASGTPFFINRSQETIELLGADYPLFYNDQSSFQITLNEEELLQAHHYLLELVRNRVITANTFTPAINKLLTSANTNTTSNGSKKVTVVTVVLNMPELLERTIQSVIAQDYPNLEYVIIDGGSDSETLDVIKKYESHIDFWISEPDKGIYDAMNKGAKYATGTWVNFLNAGDTFISDSTVTEVFKIANVDDDLIYGDTLFQDEAGEKVVKASDPEHLWRAMVFNHNSLFVRTSLQREHPFSYSYKIVADSEFIIWCYVNGKKFKNVGISINTYESGGYADQNSVMRSVERWKVVSDYKLKPQQEINDFYFQRLLWEDSCKAYLKTNYKVNL